MVGDGHLSGRRGARTAKEKGGGFIQARDAEDEEDGEDEWGEEAGALGGEEGHPCAAEGHGAADCARGGNSEACAWCFGRDVCCCLGPVTGRGGLELPHQDRELIAISRTMANIRFGEGWSFDRG